MVWTVHRQTVNDCPVCGDGLDSREEILTDPPLARASGTEQLLDAIDRSRNAT